jgi:hypothetical protein
MIARGTEPKVQLAVTVVGLLDTNNLADQRRAHENFLAGPFYLAVSAPAADLVVGRIDGIFEPRRIALGESP